MFDSGITADSFIKKLEKEIDTPVEFGTDTCDYFVQYLNTVEKLLYRNTILEKYSINVPIIDATAEIQQITIAEINTALADTYADINALDIICIYAGDIELSKCTILKFNCFDNVFSINDNVVLIKADVPAENVDIKIIVSPALHTITKETDGSYTVSGNVMIPYEYVPMIESYCRSEQYKLINEDTISAKWANDFNAQVESFKAFIISNVEGLR